MEAQIVESCIRYSVTSFIILNFLKYNLNFKTIKSKKKKSKEKLLI